MGVKVGVGQTLRHLDVQIQKTQTEAQLQKQLPLPLLIDFLCALPDVKRLIRRFILG